MCAMFNPGEQEYNTSFAEHIPGGISAWHLFGTWLIPLYGSSFRYLQNWRVLKYERPAT